ncbi:SOS response-associated peptidase family protein [Methylobacillus glycogenes]|uniref:SOS response-associated peptidase family protein n=1 Tax=Methylobacillus glycogenes TaxID=406 RepID=UPI0022773251|nr:SOS response-associated peptidase family protein [Methylobacillus glycogenes]
MCSNYLPVLNPATLKKYFKVTGIDPGLKLHTWPGYISPFIRKHEHADVGDEAVPFRELMPGAFGMIPHWSKDTKITRTTYNARSETVAEKNSFRDAWRLGRHCIVPAEAIYEPDYRTGKAVWTKISRLMINPWGLLASGLAGKIRPTVRSCAVLPC